MQKTISDWNAYVMQRRMRGDVINLSALLLMFVVHYQSVTFAQVQKYVYGRYGYEYRSVDFNNMLKHELQCLVRAGRAYTLRSQRYRYSSHYPVTTCNNLTCGRIWP